MLGWLLRLLLLFMLVRALMLIVGGLIRGLIGAAQVPDEPRQGTGAGSVARSHGTLVQDPVCGTYILQERALPMKTAGGTAFFCSERCREQWERQ